MQDLGLELFLSGNNFFRLLEGMGVALEISLIAVLLSIPLGVLYGTLMASSSRWLYLLCRFYLEFIRIMPQLVLLFVVFFGSIRILGFDISGEMAAILVFTLWGTAEMGDLVRGSLESISKNQYEAAYALGLSKKQTYCYIIIPEAIRSLLPLTVNLITRMIKTTSLVLMIGVVEVLKVAQQIIDANRVIAPNASFGVFLVVLIMYFIVCFPISQLAKYLERRWSFA